jgi:hypothetical protein
VKLCEIVNVRFGNVAPRVISWFDAGVETAVALSSLPACPYAGPLLASTSVEVNGFWRVRGFALVDPNSPRELVPRVGLGKF